ncbi:PorT family protein [Flavobacterium sp. ENC]|uniref:PorT family protein n=1 Tax=Flavobacterium sp. ENC TaxID=2897330 RepID=UPI001E3DA895|nr:PorT family protein [Flavobacterium sp. ENC]MCD0467395.1 PorT family protein [Flavobacterium sp. ENC]
MKKILLLTLFFYYTISNAQISFEKGYFISNSGKRTECYIKNLDWKDNPTNFKYKTELTDSEPATESIATVQEFGIDNESTYKRFKIKIDRSSDDLKKISMNRNPDWREETIFLKVLVAGDATLYGYTEGNTNRYFYDTKTIPTEQLIYVKFIQADKNEGAERISENNEYKQQLFRNVKSEGTTEKEILNLKYKKDDLTEYFSKFNNISPASGEENGKRTTKSQFFIKITPGISIASTSMKNTAAAQFTVDLDKKMIFKIGAEAEYILPYNKNKWSVFVNPTYQKYDDEKDYSVYTGFISNPQIPYNVKINHSSIQLPIGVRHYMFLNQNSKIFINAAYSLDVSSKTDIVYTNKTDNSTVKFDGNPGKNLAFGLGYNFKNKFSAEMRFNTKNELVNYVYHSAKYSSIDFIFGYTIF